MDGLAVEAVWLDDVTYPVESVKVGSVYTRFSSDLFEDASISAIHLLLQLNIPSILQHIISGCRKLKWHIYRHGDTKFNRSWEPAIEIVMKFGNLPLRNIENNFLIFIDCVCPISSFH